MFHHNITRTLGADIAVEPAAAGQTAVNGKTIDAAGFESVAFLVSFGAITAGAVTGIKIQAGDESDGSDMADIAGSAVSVPDSASNKGVWSAEIHRPTKRFLRAVVTRGTANAVVNGGFALLGRAGVQPPDAGANMVDAVPPVLVSVP